MASVFIVRLSHAALSRKSRFGSDKFTSIILFIRTQAVCRQTAGDVFLKLKTTLVYSFIGRHITFANIFYDPLTIIVYLAHIFVSSAFLLFRYQQKLVRW